MNALKIDNIVFSDLKEKDLMRNLEGGRLTGELKMTSNRQMTKMVTAAGLQLSSVYTSRETVCPFHMNTSSVYTSRKTVCVPIPHEHQLPYSVITTPSTVV